MSNRKPELFARITHGTAVILERHMVALVAELVRDGIRYRTKTLGRPESKLDAGLHRWLSGALAQIEMETSTPRREVETDSRPLEETEGEVIDVREAARILGRHRRTVANMASSLDGWGGGQGRAWKFRRANVEAYAESQKHGVA